MRFLIVALLCMLLTAPAEAQKRVALVIGNNAYKSEAVLKNAVNDARLVAASLAKASFSVIDVKPDLGIAEFRQALRRFQAQADGAEVALIYYAGHGLEAVNTNWLIPTDAVLETERDLEYEAIRIDLALQALSGARMRMLVLDACRNNPFGRSWRPGARSVSRGLRPIDTDDVLVLFAAAPGQTASDGDGGNSPFASAFAKRVPEPGLAVQLLGGRVRDDVLGATGGSQRPYVNASITGEPFYLVGAPSIAASAPLAPAQQSAAAEAWAHAKDSRSVTELEAFVRRFGDTYFGDLAKARLDDLNREAERLRVAALEKQKSEEEARRDPLLALQPGNGQFARDRLANGQPCPMCPELVVVPAGRFTMGSPPSEPGREAWAAGSESPQVDITLAQPFLISRFTVTRGEYAAFVAATSHKMEGGCHGHYTGSEWKLHPSLSWQFPGFQQTDEHPVVCVSWNDANAYVQWLTRQTGMTYKLPSEAEREYSARAGTTTAFWWGAGIVPDQAQYSRQIPYNGGPTAAGATGTAPVNSFQPNPWGLYQVHGNVHELTEDCWQPSHRGAAANGAARVAAECAFRTSRSGGWNNHPFLLRAAARGSTAPDVRQVNLGFRVVRALQPQNSNRLNK